MLHPDDVQKILLPDGEWRHIKPGTLRRVKTAAEEMGWQFELSPSSHGRVMQVPFRSIVAVTGTEDAG